MSVRVTRIVVALGVLLAGAIALSGCAGATSSGDSRGEPTASSTPAASDSATTAPGADADATGSAGDPGVAERDQEPFSGDAFALRCLDGQFALAVEPLPDESGAGSFGFSLVFTNMSDDACSFDGWPGLIAIAADGAEVGMPAVADAGTSSLVVVPAGGVATAHVRASQAGAYDCTPVDASGVRARLSPDGADAGIDAAYAITVCDGDVSTMTISPLVVG
ncbi:DUF4232 domain-containing protein [Agromyces sp. NPDC127015]|uniref:DUF4232 domain-containing protein n=1 Tax=Agromyces sp. NPDC127015 TaxID=3347108 RepID=UPI00365C1E3C